MDYVPLGPALHHMLHLLTEFPDVTRNRFAVVAGLPTSTVCDILHGRKPSGTINRSTHAAIMAVQPRHLAMLRPHHVDAGPVRDHAAALLRVPGVSVQSIAYAAGYAPQTLHLILRGVSQQARRATAEAFLGVTVEAALARSKFTDRQPTVVRLRALQANGWSMAALAEIAGVQPKVLDGAVRGADLLIRPHIADLVERIYRQVGDAPGPSPQARNTGRRMGYWPPIHYDDDMRLIRDSIPSGAAPGEDPQMQARRQLCAARMAATGINAPTAAARLGMTRGAAAKARERAGLRLNNAHQPADGMIVLAPGLNDVCDAIRAATEGIEWTERTEVLDDHGIDYQARWQRLVTGEWRRQDQADAA